MSDEKEFAVRNANVRELMKQAHFREVIWDILSLCEVYSSIPGKYVAGKRSVGLNIIEMLNDAEPSSYAKLLLERTEND